MKYARLLTGLVGGAVVTSFVISSISQIKEDSIEAVSLRQSGLTALGKVPLYFEGNLGQADNKAEFVARAPGYQVLLTPKATTLLLMQPMNDGAGSDNATKASTFRMEFAGSTARSELKGEERQMGKSHYLRGADPEGWTRDVPHFAKVRYEELYKGIDLVFYGNPHQLEYDFVVAPGADPSQIRLRLTGVEEAQIDERGDLHLTMAGQKMVQKAPVAYQERNGQRVPVQASYLLASNEVTFDVANYDQTASLVIDPVLVYSTYLGGSGSDQAAAIAVDAAKNVYVTGKTWSVDFPVTTGVYDTECGTALKPCDNTVLARRDAFVAKLTSTGQIDYVTFIGGDEEDEGRGIAVNAVGEVFVTGYTHNVNTTVRFPTTATAVDTNANNDGSEAFFFKLDASGSSLLYSTVLGGSGGEEANAIAIDAGGNAYITGQTSTYGNTLSPFPATFTIGDPTNASCAGSVFVAKFNPNQSGSASLVYAARFCGDGYDQGLAIALDAFDAAYVTGTTRSAAFPTTMDAYDTTCGSDGACDGGAIRDAFVLKLNPAGTALEYSTFLGGSGVDNDSNIGLAGIAVDSQGRAYITGNTYSRDFPVTADAYDPVYNISTYTGSTDVDAFVSRLSADGSALEYSTFLGGTMPDAGTGIVIDDAGRLYVTGYTTGSSFPLHNQIMALPTISNREVAFVTEFDPAGKVLFSSGFGGVGGNEKSFGIVLDEVGDIYLAGQTTDTSGSLALSAAQAAHAGGTYDAFIAKIEMPVDLGLTLASDVASVAPGAVVTYTASVNNNTLKDATNVVLTLTLPAGGVAAAPSLSQGTCTGTGTITCDLGTIAARGNVTLVQKLTVGADAVGTLSTTADVALAETDENLEDNSAGNMVSVVVPAPPATETSSGGGGGALDWWGLLGLAFMFFRRRGTIHGVFA